MPTRIDIEVILEKGKIESELDFKRVYKAYNRIRLLSKKDNIFGELENILFSLIKSYHEENGLVIERKIDVLLFGCGIGEG